MVDELVARSGIHIVNSKLIQSARDTHDLAGRSLLAFDRTGALVRGSQMAMAGFDLSETDAQVLQNWLTDCDQKPVSQITPLVMQGNAFRYVGVSNAQEILVKFTKTSGESNEQMLARRLSLTSRESEVLYWLTLGKTNPDISIVLGLSPRTVNKHLEQIFQKMDVDNRTSAAVAADRILHASP